MVRGRHGNRDGCNGVSTDAVSIVTMFHPCLAIPASFSLSKAEMTGLADRVTRH